MLLIITSDTFTPRLKEIESELTVTSHKAVTDAHNIYTKIQHPLVPMSDKSSGHQGRLLSSMKDVHILNTGDNYGLQFGFYAYDPEDGFYAKLQEENPLGWAKHTRYAGHTPIDFYFYTAIQKSEQPMFNAINKRFRNLLR